MDKPDPNTFLCRNPVAENNMYPSIRLDASSHLLLHFISPQNRYK